MKIFFCTLLISTAAMADRVCGTVRNVSTIDTDMITFSISLPAETGWRVFNVPPEEVLRVLPMALSALGNPKIETCVLTNRSGNLVVELTNR